MSGEIELHKNVIIEEKKSLEKNKFLLHLMKIANHITSSTDH